MNIEKAKTFVRKQGNAVEQARLEYLLTQKLPTRDEIEALFAGQRPDGGWAPFWAHAYSSLDATCFRLAQAEQLGIFAAEEAVQRAGSFLAQRQSSDGSWEEHEAVADLAPPWAMPGNLAAKLYLTANCGFWLALLVNTEPNATQASDYLQSHLDPDGKLPGFIHTNWLAAGLWSILGRRNPVERVTNYINILVPDLATSNLSWLITTMFAAGATADHPLIDKAVSMLVTRQNEDGRWPSEDGPHQDVHVTLEALRALMLCGLFK
jgi:hypothetical protein